MPELPRPSDRPGISIRATVHRDGPLVWPAEGADVRLVVRHDDQDGSIWLEVKVGDDHQAVVYVLEPAGAALLSGQLASAAGVVFELER